MTEHYPLTSLVHMRSALTADIICRSESKQPKRQSPTTKMRDRALCVMLTLVKLGSRSTAICYSGVTAMPSEITLGSCAAQMAQLDRGTFLWPDG